MYLSLFLCYQDYEKTAGPISMKFSGKVRSDHGTTWFNLPYILAYKSQNLRQNHGPKVRGRLIRGS